MNAGHVLDCDDAYAHGQQLVQQQQATQHAAQRRAHVAQGAPVVHCPEQYYEPHARVPQPHLPVSQAPPALPRRRGPTACACSLACLFCCGVLSFGAMVLTELPYVAYETSSMLQQRRVNALRAGADVGAQRKGTAHFGMWDEHLSVSPLQLLVALSMALSVEEGRIRVSSSGDSFFEIDIDGEADWIVDAINGPNFLPALNGQASVFGAKMVISHAASLVANATAR